MISIRRSPKYQLLTVYWRDHAIAGITSPKGIFIGRFVMVFAKSRLLASYNGRRLL